MRVIAIIGPFTAPTDEQRQANIDAADALAFEVWKLGAIAYCSHTMTGHHFGKLPDEIFIAGHLQMALGCHAGILVAGWRASKNSVTERAALKAQGKPVFESLDELKAWLDA